MDQRIRCQSCAMPLGEGYYGTDSDGKDNLEFCKFCYQNCNFTKPHLTLQEMIELSGSYMVKDLHMEETHAQESAEKLIPKLKRWATL